MDKYIVSFEFRNEYGVWIPDAITNNGDGMSLQEALHVAFSLIHADLQPTRYVHCEVI